jgi:hypothetical protein
LPGAARAAARCLALARLKVQAVAALQAVEHGAERMDHALEERRRLGDHDGWPRLDRAVEPEAGQP